MPLGVHLSMARGLKKTMEKALALGFSALQIFAKNPRSWRAGPFDTEGASFVRMHRKTMGIQYWAVHMAYLNNPCSQDPDLFDKTLASLQLEAWRSQSMGADALVIHPGNRKGSSVEEAILRVQKTIEMLLMFPEIQILVENTPGSGSQIGACFSELGKIVSPFPLERVGMCFDTCHAFARNYDLRTENNWQETLNQLFEAIHPQRLRLIHVNDSKYGLGSGRDGHTHPGQGYIGLEGFQAMMTAEQLQGIPMILETPGNPEMEGQANITLLKGLATQSEEQG